MAGGCRDRRRHPLFDALCHHVVLSDGAGGVKVQGDVQLLGSHQGITQPQGEAGTQLLRFTGLITELRHVLPLHLLLRTPEKQR